MLAAIDSGMILATGQKGSDRIVSEPRAVATGSRGTFRNPAGLLDPVATARGSDTMRSLPFYPVAKIIPESIAASIFQITQSVLSSIEVSLRLIRRLTKVSDLNIIRPRRFLRFAPRLAASTVRAAQRQRQSHAEPANYFVRRNRRACDWSEVASATKASSSRRTHRRSG